MAYGDLCALADVKSYLDTGGQLTARDDALLARLITAASQFILTRIGRPILAADWQETRDGLTGLWGQGDARFQFAVTPCMAVLSVVVDNIAIPPVPALTPGAPGVVTSLPFGFQAGYLFSPTQLVIRGYLVPRRAQCVAIQYTAGYPSVPPDLAEACIELVCLRYRERQRIGLVSQHLGGETTSYWMRSSMTPSIAEAVNRYRQVAPIAGSGPQLAPTATDSATLAAAIA